MKNEEDLYPWTKLTTQQLTRELQMMRGVLAGILLARMTQLSLTPGTPQNRMLTALLEMAPDQPRTEAK